jgi:hypothetical protein
VLLANADYAVWRAVELPRAVIKATATYNGHVNGHILHATDAILDHRCALDVTDHLRRLDSGDA